MDPRDSNSAIPVRAAMILIIAFMAAICGAFLTFWQTSDVAASLMASIPAAIGAAGISNKLIANR